MTDRCGVVRAIDLITAPPVGTAALRAAAAAAAALLDLPVPARWAWTVEAGGGRPPEARLGVTSLDAGMTADAVSAAMTALRLRLPWSGWAGTSPRTVADLPIRVAVVPGAADSLGPSTGRQPTGPDLLLPWWADVGIEPGRHRLTVSLHTPGISGATPLGTLVVAGASPAVLVVAALLAAGLSDMPGELCAVPQRRGSALLPLTATRVGRCLGVPYLVDGGWPEDESVKAAQRHLHQLMVDRIDRLLGNAPKI